MVITEFKCGTYLRLRGFGNTPLPCRQRLLFMGMTPGVSIQLIRKAPLGCPVQIEVRGTALVLRTEEIQFLQWEPIE